ncbi:MAG: hypothetical protein IJ383_07050 [Bacteroidales bacterium]|nr:hypothetical protein [Bacteroidales bacterium]
MHKTGFVRRILIVAALFLAFGPKAVSQDTDALGTYTPYSLFGIGDIQRQGTAFNMGMGGIGTGVRDNRVINYLNPASITERDTLSFMLDFGLVMKNFYNTDKNVESAYNTANMQNVIFTAPIYKKSALIVGVTPYSSIGYKFQSKEQDKELIAKYGDISYEKYGTGSINQLFAGAAVNLSKNVAVGAEMIYYFGALNRYSNVSFDSDASVRNINTGWDYDVRALSGRIGVQYFGNIAKNTILTVGATYRLKSQLDGDHTSYALAVSSSTMDTVKLVTSPGYKVDIPSEISLGFSIKKQDKWMVGFDYTRQDWKGSFFGETPGVDFKPSVASSFRVGFEYIPNRYDIRYYLKRATYRFGAYYDKSYVNIAGNQVNAAGITLGMSMPIFRWYNALTWSVDLGQRGSLENGMVRERYVQVNLNFNLHDMWFIKKRYQ